MRHNGVAKAKKSMVLAMLCAFFAPGLFADVKTMAESGLITWTGAAESWIGDNGDELLLKFTDTATAGTLTIDDSIKATARILVVGGGGAGGTSPDTANGAGGGGGAGGFAEFTEYSLTGGVYVASVGAGGLAATSGDTACGEDGKPSVFAFQNGPEILYICGGGGGGAACAGNSGGSGGGGSRAGSSTQNGGSTTNKTDYGVAIGNAGGKGNSTKYGAGGGGAGGVGGTGSSVDRKGGKGASSDITGAFVTYSGGGGGGRSTGTSATGGGAGGGGKGGSTTQDATSGEPNTGGGGGGGGSGPGGAGGSGVIIVRLTAAQYVLISEPAVENFTWDGNVHTGVVEDVSYTLSGELHATGAGTYTVHVTPADGVKWADTRTGEARDLVWTISPFMVEKPAVPSGVFMYNGSVQTGVVESAYSAYYTLSGDYAATDAALYTYSASLVDSANCRWADGTAGGSTEDVQLEWEITPAPVEKPAPPAGLVYAGTNQAPFTAAAGLSFADGSVTNATDAGTYAYTALLQNSVNYRWSDGTTGDIAGTWTIAQAANAITSLSIDGWKVGESAIENEPVVTAAVTNSAATAVFAYASSTNAAEDAWHATAPTNAGTWWVRATIPETGNWTAATGYASFVLWDDPDSIFRDHVEIAVTGYAGTAPLTNFPLLVKISESRIPGFLYSRAGSDGADLAFLDAGGNPLAYEVDTWRSGESLVWVRLPELPVRVDGTNTVIRMYWGVRPGQVSPGPSAARVWGDYTGVWHFSENAVSNNAASTAAADSTGNGYDARPFSNNAQDGRWRMVGVEGAVGTGRQIETQLYTNGNRLSVTNSDLSTGDTFTFSGWLNLQGAYSPSGTASGGYLNHLFSRRTGHNDAVGGGGFAAIINRSGTASKNLKEYLAYGYGGSALTAKASSDSVALQNAGWSYFSFSYSGTRITAFCANATGAWTSSGTISAATDNALPLSFGQSSSGSSGYQSLWGQIDEYRLRKGAVSAEWAAAEYANATDDAFIEFGLVVRDGLKVDYWKSEPSVSPTRWIEGETPSITLDMGELASGLTVSNYFYSIYDPETVYYSISDLSAAGPYRAVFTVADGDGYEELFYTIDLFILGDQGGSGIAGNAGDSGRILLMNRDTVNAQCRVDYQSHDCVSSEDSTFWEWVTSATDTLPATWNLADETESILWTKDYGARLWHLVDCRHGNTYKRGDTSTGTANLEADQNYLPFNTANGSYSYLSRGTRASRNERAAMLIMRNTTNACVYSSCFVDGIGTVYFDAVNGWTENAGSCYGLVVEIATNTVEGLPPTDENSFTVGEGDVTNHYANLDGCWRPMPATAYNTATESDEPAALTNELAITAGKSKDKFYRIRVPLDIRSPVRFRIRRATAVPQASWGIDEKGFVLLDNIIVSYPAMRATLSTAGRFDETLRGKRTLGWENAFSVAFPSVADSGVLATAVPSYYTNSMVAAEAVDTSTFFAAAKMHYRWRYLDQAFGDWMSADLNPNNGFKSVQEILMPAMGCDLEYWFEGTLQAPYYKYVDYTGLNKGVPGYSEAVTAVNCGAETGGVKFESQGTNWFVRVREGASDYEGFRVIVREAGAEAATTNEMNLVASRVWRGFAKTPAAVEGGLEFRFEGVNPQAGGWADFAFSTNCFRAAADLSSLPVSTTIVESDTNDWGTVACDAATGYLMFQLDESTRSLTVAHADYQNFNTWHDAHSADGAFVGSSTEDEKKSGASSQTREYSEGFGTWSDMYPSAYDDYWKEGFESSSRTSANGYAFNGYMPYEVFTGISTPNGWYAGPGMWTYSQYRDATKGFALQMKGQGAGYLQFVQSSALAPRGLESVSFKARLAQDIAFDTMSYRFSGNSLMKKDYTFFVPASMGAAANDFDGDGTVSAIAYYQPMRGCYELRATKVSATSIVLELYRWSRSSSGAVTGERLNYRTMTGFSVNTSNKTGGLLYSYSAGGVMYTGGLLICCETLSGGTRLVAGYRAVDAAPGDNVTASTTFTGLTYTDTASSRLKAGSYGVTCKSCPARFFMPRHWDDVITPPAWNSGNAANGTFNTQSFPELTTTGVESDADSLAGDEWAVDTSRVLPVELPATGLVATQTVQHIAVEWAPAGTVDWQTLTNVTVSGYSMSGTVTAPLYFKDDASVRFKHVGEDSDARTDVVIDDVSFKQWRGGDLGGREAPIVGDDVYGWVTNFYYSSCWITNHALRMSGKRTQTNDLCTIRMPLMDGNGSPARGIGLGMISFEYENAQENVNILLQVATNGVADSLRLYNKSNDPFRWTTVTNFSFSGLSAAERAKGMCSFYLGLHGVKGVMRLLLDPKTVDSAASQTDPSRFGEIDITSVFCRDEPSLDTTCWWGWNLRTVGSDGYWPDYDSGKRSYLPDMTGEAAGTGLSLALNNSTETDCRAEDRAAYEEHMPFVQTPTFSSNVVGEVSFRARKFALSDVSQTAEVALYGATSGDITDDSSWTELARFAVTGTIYETYTYRSDGDTYRAFRLGVTGVSGVNAASRGAKPSYGASPVRVMLDEIAVYEAVRPTMGFRYVYPFRTGLDQTAANTGVVDADGLPLPDEQPLANESWTVQAEIEPRQLPDEIDLSTPGHEPRVFFSWYVGVRPWGHANWRTNAAAHRVELALADGESMVFRGSLANSRDAVVTWDAATMAAPERVQYAAEVVYWNVNGGVQTNTLLSTEWKRPGWYAPVDYNADYRSSGFSAYTILDTVAPKRVWINEVNIWDGRDRNDNFLSDTNQFVEIAVPRRQSLEGWRLEYFNSLRDVYTICEFGSDTAADKTLNETNDYVFITVQSPKAREAGAYSAAAGEVDGAWRDFDGWGGILDASMPIAFRLTRPSGVVEHEIVVEGTNAWVGTVWAADYSAAIYCENLNDELPGSAFFPAGDENGTPPSNSLGVTNVPGAVAADWTKYMKKTPGRCNEGQIIPAGYAIFANGDTLLVRSRIGADGYGHVRQTFGTAAGTLEEVLAMTMKGDAGTNIVYTIDKWWELKSVTTNGVAVAGAAGATGEYTFTAGKGQSNDVIVVATAQPRADLRTTWGLDENNRYRDAVMDWLGGGATMRGGFKGDSITSDAWFKGIFSNTAITNLDLTTRYWLDIDPTEPGWVLRGGVVSAPKPIAGWIATGSEDDPQYEMVEDFDITIRMFITNENSTAESYGTAYSPYVLRGLAPGSASSSYSLSGSPVWTSATFKVTGDIQNGKPLRRRWVPLRRFVFTGSGTSSTSFDANHESTIRVWDPFSPDSIVTRSWSSDTNCPVYYSWAIDSQGGPDTVEPLKPDSTYPVDWPDPD